MAKVDSVLEGALRWLNVRVCDEAQRRGRTWRVVDEIVVQKPGWAKPSLGKGVSQAFYHYQKGDIHYALQLAPTPTPTQAQRGQTSTLLV